MFGDGNEESSEAVGRMNMGDSVNDSEMAEVDVTVLKFNEMRPPT